MESVNPMSSTYKQDVLNWIDNAMLKDLRQVLNSPWLAIQLEKVSPVSVINCSYKTGPNFAANALVMIALEYVGRLATGRKEGLGSTVAFVKKYFPDDYHGCIELVWQLFRNGHIHNHFPNRVLIADATVFGQVVWIEKLPPEFDETLEIGELESRIKANRSTILSALNPGHLQLKQTNQNIYAFSFYPQIAYVDLELAIKKWHQDLASDCESNILFSQGILISKDAASAIYALESPMGNFLKEKGVI